MHLLKLRINSEGFPTREDYPFNLKVFQETREVEFQNPITFFIGENGTGKSTLLKAIAKKSSIHIWKGIERKRQKYNPHEDNLFRHLELEWAEKVPGSFFASEIFFNFVEALDEWARVDQEMLKYYGGESLLTKSHGQGHMSYFENRYRLKGLYLIDEPENALSPKKQLELFKILEEMSELGHAQFIIATHSPILLALPGSSIYSFDYSPLRQVKYEETDYYKVYKQFFNHLDFDQHKE